MKQNMAANNKTQMVLSHDNSIIISNSHQPPLTWARQPSFLQWSLFIRFRLRLIA